MAQSRDSGVKSADRTLDLLEFVAQAQSPPSFAELSRSLGIPKSSLFHLLATLSCRGYVEQVMARGGYRLGPAVLELARHVFNPDTVLARVRPLIRELSGALNETVGFYEMRGDYAELMVTSSAWHPLRIEMPLGRMMPLYAASNGRVLLAQLTDEQISAYLARVTFEAFTPATKGSADELKHEVATIRRTGFAESHGEFAVGIMSIAMALREHGRVVGSIGVILPTPRFTKAFGREIRRQMLAAASRFERASDCLTTADALPATELSPPAARE